MLQERQSIGSYRGLSSAFLIFVQGCVGVSQGVSIRPLADTKRIIQKLFPRTTCEPT